MVTASDASSQLDQVKAGYAFDGPALEFGAAVSDGTAQPGVPVRLPLGVLKGEYAEMIDRESAYEKLKARMQAAPTPDQASASDPTGGPAPTPAGREPKAKESMVEQVVTSSAFKSMLRSAGTVLGREITRSIFGTALRGR